MTNKDSAELREILNKFEQYIYNHARINKRPGMSLDETIRAIEAHTAAQVAEALEEL